MTLQEAIQQRHSVRHYVSKPLNQTIVDILNDKIKNCNLDGNLHIQLVLNEKKGFSGLFSYGKFSGVENYIVMAGKKDVDFDERIGYYGEQLVLLAQQLGLGTCWAGLSYRKVAGTFKLLTGEKIACMIALGYPENNGKIVKHKSVSDVSNANDTTPDWFRAGVEAALLAPTAVNQQKFYFEYIEPQSGGKAKIKATVKFSLVGYTKIDLGIAKLHFEIGAGKEHFDWI